MILLARSLAILGLLCSFTAEAAAQAPARHERGEGTSSEDLPTRSIWLAGTYQLLLTDAFGPDVRHGGGLSASYEFHISTRFNLGLSAAYRFYPARGATQQLGYGAILKHFLSSHWATQAGVYPYFDYGLLLQQSFVKGRQGNAVSHDTRLGAGLLVQAGLPWFTGVAVHYSRLEALDTDSKFIPYIDVQVGVAPAF